MDEWLTAGLPITLTNTSNIPYNLTWTMKGSDGINIDVSGFQLPSHIDASGTKPNFLLTPLPGFTGYGDPVQFMSNFWSTFTIELRYGGHTLTTIIQLPTMTYTTSHTETNPSIIISHGNPIKTLYTDTFFKRNETGVFTVTGLTDGQYYPYSIIASTPTKTYISDPETVFIPIYPPTLPSVVMTQTDVGTITITFPTNQNEPTTTYDVSVAMASHYPSHYQWIDQFGSAYWCSASKEKITCTTSQPTEYQDYYSGDAIITFTDSNETILPYTRDPSGNYILDNGGLLKFNKTNITDSNNRDILINSYIPKVYDLSGSIQTASSILWDLSNTRHTDTSCSPISSTCHVINFDTSVPVPIQVSPFTSSLNGTGTFTITNLQPVSYQFTVTARTQALTTSTQNTVVVKKMPPFLQWPTNQPNITQSTNGHVTIVTQINDNPHQMTFTPSSTYYE